MIFGKTLRILSLLMVVLLVVFVAGCGLFADNGDEPGDPNGVDSGEGNGTADPIVNDPDELLDLLDLKVLARLDVFKAVLEIEDYDAFTVELHYYFHDHQEIDGKETNMIVMSALFPDEDEEEIIILWITDEGDLVMVQDSGGYVLSGGYAQDWVEFELPETDALLPYVVAQEFFVDQLAPQAVGQGWRVLSTSSETATISNHRVNVVTYEVEYSPPLTDETVVVEWKIADFSNYRFIVGFYAPGLSFTVSEVSFR